MKNYLKGLGFALLAVALSAVPTQSVQAKFGMVANYKYLSTDKTLLEAHGAEIDFLWSIKGYHDEGKIPKHSLGFSFGGGVVTKSPSALNRNIVGSSFDDNFPSFNDQFPSFNSTHEGSGPTSPSSRTGQESSTGQEFFISLSLLYGYAFPFGLGISGGFGMNYVVFGDPAMSIVDDIGRNFGGGPGPGEAESYLRNALGYGLSDFGLRYHFKNGLVLSFTSDLMYLRKGGIYTKGLLYSVGTGIGYWF